MEKILLFNKGIMFCLELCILAALAYWGFHNHQSTLTSWLFGLGVPLAAALIWSVFAAPKSSHRLAMPSRALFSIAFFWISALLLYRTGAKGYAIALMVISFLSVSIAALLEE